MPTFFLYDTERNRRWKVQPSGNRIRIGRSRDAEVPVPHASVSKRHVIVRRRGSRYTFRDVGSRNGTMINDLRTDEGPLENGDELRIGPVRIRFFTGKPPAEIWANEPASSTTDPLLDSSLLNLEETELRAPPPAVAAAEEEIKPDAPIASVTAPPSSAGTPETDTAGSKPPSGSEALETAPIQAERPAEPESRAPAPQAETKRAKTKQAKTKQAETKQAETKQAKTPPTDELSGTLEHGGIDDELDFDDVMDSTATTAWIDPAVSGVGDESARPRARARDHSIWIIVGILGLCLAIGLALGALIPFGDEPDPDGEAGRLDARNGDVRSAAGAPSLEPGAVADLADVGTSFRSAVRLCLDILGRPPLRSELRELLPVSHEDRWIRVDGWNSGPPRLPVDPAGRFLALLGRPPSPSEHGWLRKEADDDIDRYTFLIVSSQAYASVSNRRPRTLEQVASSLIVDLKDRPASQSGVATLIATLKKASLPQDLARVAKAVTRAKGTIATPSGPQERNAWVLDLYARTLLRLPSDEERTAAFGRLERDGDRAAVELLLEMSGRAEYLEY